jgi:hypothetical protein
MKRMPRMVYMDTNILRHFGATFSESSLDEELRNRLVMSPTVVMELLSQLATAGAEDAFAAVQAIPRVYPSQVGLLPWAGDAFREAVFGLPAQPDTLTERIGHAVNLCLNSTMAELRSEASNSRKLVEEAKQESVANFTAFLKAWKREGPLVESDRRRIFASSIATRAGITVHEIDVDDVVERLDALYVYDLRKLETAAKEKEYNVEKHANDLFDAEQLIYLAYPEFNFVTCDAGFKRVATSSQFARIHVVPTEEVTDHERASSLLRGILKLK